LIYKTNFFIIYDIIITIRRRKHMRSRGRDPKELIH
jgi:hypothetical protein